jgi:tRNA pseudouridine38/39 synthase
MSSFIRRSGAALLSWLQRYRDMSLPLPCSGEAELRAMSRDQLVDRVIELTRSSASGAPHSFENNNEKQVNAHTSRDLLPELPAKKRKRSDREFDMSRYGQRMIALKLSYLGWHFHGFATQPHSAPSVEDHIFSALLKTRLIESRESCEYSRAGRTDVGVSALGQVIGLRVRSNVMKPSEGLAELDYVKMLNSMLPVHVRALIWAPVTGSAGRDATCEHTAVTPDDNLEIVDPYGRETDYVRRPGAPFSARFDALYRSYKYFFKLGTLNVSAMQAAACSFVGRHDFRNFCKIDAEKVTNFVRVMHQVEIRREHDDSMVTEGETSCDGEHTQMYIFVRGQAFLWHQVRCMAAVLFEVGMGNEQPAIVERMLRDASRRDGAFSGGKPSYVMAPPTPLLLFECGYPPSVVSFDVPVATGASVTATSFGRADAELGSLYAEAAAQTSILRTMLKADDDFRVRYETRENEIPERFTCFGSERAGRLLLPFAYGRYQAGRRHIPFERRKREDSLEEKQKRIAERRKLIGTEEDLPS